MTKTEVKIIKHTLITITLFGLVGLLFGITPAQANTPFTVNVTVDAPDKTPGNGVCETDTGNGVCTLRAAIMEANAFPGTDTIILPNDKIILTIPGPEEDSGLTGDLDITHPLTIIGPGANNSIIDGNGSLTNDRVLHLIGAINVSISGVTIQNGKLVDNSNFVKYGSGIYNEGTLTLNDSVISHNTFTGPIEGGGIANLGVLTLNNSAVISNTAYQAGGIYNAQGTLTVNNSFISGNTSEFSCSGGIGNVYYGTATLSNVTVIGNTAGGNCGGGIYNAGAMTVKNSTITGNSAKQSGGGIHNNGTLYVDHTTIAGNQADNDNNSVGSGGGIANYGGTLFITNSSINGNSAAQGGGILGDEQVFISNSTISGNQANQQGGGIATEDHYPGSSAMSLTNVTITGNTADFDKDSTGDGGGIYIASNTSLTAKNSLIAGNTDASSGPSFAKPSDCFGTLSSAGFNLVGRDTGCNGLTNGVNGDQVGTGLTPLPPLLGLLQDNGGATQTHALLNGSPAIDTGDPAGCKDNDDQTLITDQRGYNRPAGVRCDIGAFEFGATAPAPSPSPTPTPPPSGSPESYHLYLPIVLNP